MISDLKHYPLMIINTINPKGLHQADGIPGHLLNGTTGAGLTAVPPRAPAPMSERQLPGYRARLAATHRAAELGGRAPAGPPKGMESLQLLGNL